MALVIQITYYIHISIFIKSVLKDNCEFLLEGKMNDFLFQPILELIALDSDFSQTFLSER